MNRSRPAVQRGDRVHPQGRHRQGLHGPRPVLQAPPRHRQVPRRPDGGRRDLQAEHRVARGRAAVRPPPTWRRSTTTCGSARRRSGRSTATASTTTGTGTGTTATATPATRARTSSTSRAGVCSKNEHPVKIRSVGGYFGARGVAGNAGHPDRRCSSTPTASVLEFATRGQQHQRRRRARRSATCSTAPKGWVVDRRRRPQVAVVPRAQGREGRRLGQPRRSRAAAIRTCSPASSTRTTRTGSMRCAPAIRSCSPATSSKGHMSSTLPHLANISYRVGRALRVRRQGGEVRQRQGSRQAPDARIPQGLRDQGNVLARSGEPERNVS